MKKHLLSKITLIALLLIGLSTKAQVRYFSPIFPDVTKTSQIWYDSNYSINLLAGNSQVPPSLSGPLFMASQFVDLYQPANDTASARPLIILAHTGSYLPAYINQQTTGDRTDSSLNEVARNLARRGYVVAIASYRSGWNPATTIQAQAREQLLTATYRGVQDMHACIRFFKANAATYKIDASKITVGGQGTGGYIALALGTVSTREDIESNIKFLRGDASPMVSMDTMGDWRGVGGIPPFNLPHAETVSSAAHMIVNFGGAMGDTAWMKSTSLPIVSMQAKGDRFAPYFTGNVLVPTTGAIVIPNASGAGDVIPKADAMGLNNAINKYFYIDPYSTRANAVNKKPVYSTSNNFGFETSFPIEGSPWEWWDRTAAQTKTSQVYRGIPLPVNGRVVDSLSLITNPFMSASRGKIYCDTIASFLAPRIAVRFGLEGPMAIAGFNLLTPANNASVTVKEKDTTLINITWEATSGMATYAFGLKMKDSSSSLVEQVGLPSNSFSVKASDFYTICKTAGIADGVVANLEWQVAAIRPMLQLGRLANSNFALKVTLEKATGVQELNLNNSLSLYPNPAKSEINISLKGSNTMSELVILDIMGREVYSANALNTNNQQVNLSGFTAGMYLVNIKTTNGGTATQRFIVQ
jgi:hypothetical protein